MTVTNARGDTLDLPIRNPMATGYNVVAIDGLGPVDAVLQTSNTVTTDGVIFNGARKDEREIIINLAYYPESGKSIEELRHGTYKYFPEKEEVTLVFHADTRSVRTTGIVESNDISIFSEKEASSITIKCPDPWFRIDDELNRVTSFSNVEPVFEFPFNWTNNPVSEPKPLWFGAIQNMHSKNIMYDGESEVGVIIRMSFDAPVYNIRIYNEDAGQEIDVFTDKVKLIIADGIKQGDELVICTIPKRKSVEIIRDGISYNILNAINRDVRFITLHKGANTIVYSADSGVENIHMSIENETLYTGV
jgi:hypothetical protein